MNKLILIVSILFLAACGPKKHDDVSGTTTFVDVWANCNYQMSGTRQFCDGKLMHSDAYSCGFNSEGKRCFMYRHEPDVAPADVSQYDPAYQWSSEVVVDEICKMDDAPGTGCPSN